jgi:aldehyde:ferredoxin oxidoreductase
MRDLYKQGLLGPGNKISTDLPFDKLGEIAFLQQLVALIQNKEGIGAVLSEGVPRAAKEWGLYEEGLETGHLPLQYWGYVQHYDARTEAEWGYGSLVGDRDVNEHDFNVACYWMPTSNIIMFKQQPPVSAQELSEIIAEKCSPFNDPFMIDYSDKGIYSEHMAKTVAWHRHYTRFYKQSIGYCDWAWADFVNHYRPDKRGLTPDGEVKFINAVTGRNMSFEDGMEIGKKIWNIDRAIWIIQGRDRRMEVFPPYTYDVGAMPTESAGGLPTILPAHENGRWTYKNVTGRKLDRAKVEEWKTKYYRLEGWDPETGWPKRSTLEAMDLGHVADELEKHKKLGKG